MKRNWRDLAACLDVDPELFYPLGDERGPDVSKPVVQHLEQAKAFCLNSGCPVISECLEEALRVEGYVTWGVRGATDPLERQAILRRRSRARLAARQAAQEFAERKAS